MVQLWCSLLRVSMGASIGLHLQYVTPNCDALCYDSFLTFLQIPYVLIKKMYKVDEQNSADLGFVSLKAIKQKA